MAGDNWYRTVREVLDDSPIGTRHLGTAENHAVASEGDPLEWYTVSVYRTEDGELRTCTCRGFRYTDHCYHTGKVP